MKKSLIAAAFATALPMAALAQDEPMTMAPTEPATGEACVALSATQQFCFAADGSTGQLVGVHPQVGPLLQVEGRIEEDGVSTEPCAILVAPAIQQILDYQCAPE